MATITEAAYAFCNATCALIKAMGMMTENLWRYDQQEPLAYTEEHFEALMNEFHVNPEDMADLLDPRKKAKQ